MKDDPLKAWVAGQLAVTLLAVDPFRLGGLHLRARAGPVRQGFLSALPGTLGPARRISPGIEDAQLYGGIDIAASLSAGRSVETAGLLSGGGTILLTMAERCPRALAARLGQALDARTIAAVVALDEGIEDERAPDALTERLAFGLDLEGLRAAHLTEMALAPGDIEAARTRLLRVEVSDAALSELARTAAALGIASLRAPVFAAAAARAHAALSRRTHIEELDLQIAAALVYAHRATRLPEPPDEDDAPPEDREDSPQDDSGPGEDAIPQDMLIEAVRALLPPGVLERRSAAQAAASGAGQGVVRRGNRRGRPLPARQGTPSANARIDLVATLRAAAPWQRLRRATEPDRKGLIVRKSDLRIRRFEERSDRLVIFCVDASGSAAMARLAEAKGAVETMLAEAYSKRDQVALVAFRGASAELALPPTRSLVQAKRRLAGLPGGGGTPLAAGLEAAHALALRARRQGLSPALALLTDGRANVPLPGGTGRARAMADVDRMAACLRSAGVGGAVIDTGVRPRKELSDLAAAMDLAYLALPRADAGALTAGLDAALGG